MAININPGSPVRHVSTFTASGNFTPPPGINVAFISVHSSTGGGGGGGSGGSLSSGTGGTSGDGKVSGAFVEVIPGVAHAIAIGAGGAGGAAPTPGSRYVAYTGGTGATGGTTTFDGTALAVPGSSGGVGGFGGTRYRYQGTNGGTGAVAGAPTGITSLTSLPPSGALTRTKTITQQATGGTAGSAGGVGQRYSGPAGTAGASAIVHVYI